MENTNSTNDKLIDSLEGLIAILEDGKLGYINAGEHVEDETIKTTFLGYARERSLFIVELQDEINKLGKSTDTTGGALGALHRAWIDIKSMITGGDKEAIINACITGEKAAIEKYEMTLKEENLPALIQIIVAKQLSSIQNTLTNIEMEKSHTV